MTKKVLHVIGGLAPGGIQTALLSFLKMAKRDDFECDVCSLSEIGDEDRARYAPYVANFFECSFRENCFTYRKRFSTLLKAGSYDVLHVHRSSHMMAFPLMIAKDQGVPVRIAHYQNVASNRSISIRTLANKYLRCKVAGSATILVFVSNAVSVSQYPNGTYGVDSQIIHNPCTLGVQSSKSTHDRKNTEYVIGHAARFSPAKNQRIFLDLAELNRNSNIRFLLAGDGPLRHEFEREVKRRNLESRVRVKPWQSDPTVFFREIDLFVFPSLWEGFPLTLLDVQGQGVPCICSNVPGNLEAVSQSHRELAFDPMDVSEINAKIEKVRNSPEVAKRLVVDGVEYSKAFSEEAIWRQIRELWNGT